MAAIRWRAQRSQRVFDLFEEQQIVKHVQDIAPYLEQKLDELVGKYDCLSLRRGKGTDAGASLSQAARLARL